MMPLAQQAPITDEPPAKQKAYPKFSHLFLNLKLPGRWIRIDQITSVRIERIDPDGPRPSFYRVRVNEYDTIDEVPTIEEAEAIAERVMFAVSTRLTAVLGSWRRS